MTIPKSLLYVEMKTYNKAVKYFIHVQIILEVVEDSQWNNLQLFLCDR